MSSKQLPAADSFTNPVKAGWLTKFGGQSNAFGGNWRKRWFILDHHQLFYYKHDKDKAPAGIIDLEEFDLCEQAPPAECKKSKYTFVITNTAVPESAHKRSYHAYAENQEEMDAWVKVIARTIQEIMNPEVFLHEGRFKEETEESQTISRPLDDEMVAAPKSPELSPAIAPTPSPAPIIVPTPSPASVASPAQSPAPEVTRAPADVISTQSPPIAVTSPSPAQVVPTATAPAKAVAVGFAASVVEKEEGGQKKARHETLTQPTAGPALSHVTKNRISMKPARKPQSKKRYTAFDEDDSGEEDTPPPTTAAKEPGDVMREAAETLAKAKGIMESALKKQQEVEAREKAVADLFAKAEADRKAAARERALAHEALKAVAQKKIELSLPLSDEEKASMSA
eukprot:Colp12_sorted_trinity150504_noHs@30540